MAKGKAREDMNISPTKQEGKDAVVKVGDIFESVLDGTEYIVKDIVNKLVVLQSRKADRQIITEVGSIKTKSFYREKEKERD